MSESTAERLERLQLEVKTGWSNSHEAWMFDVSDIKWLVDRAVQSEPIIDGVAGLNGYLALNKELAKSHWGQSVTKTAMDELERLQEENKKHQDFILRLYRCMGMSAERDFQLWKEIENYLGGRIEARKTLEEDK